MDIGDFARADESAIHELIEDGGHVVYVDTAAIDRLVGMMQVEIGTDSFFGSLPAWILRGAIGGARRY